MLVRVILEDKARDVITATTETTVVEAMGLLITNKIGCLPITDQDSKLIGLVSDKDIFHKIHESKGDYQSLSMADLMTTDLVVGVMEDSVAYIAKIMAKNWIRHVPIVDGDQLLGIVSQRDIIRTQSENTEAENRYLRLYTSSLGSRDKSADC